VDESSPIEEILRRITIVLYVQADISRRLALLETVLLNNRGLVSEGELHRLQRELRETDALERMLRRTGELDTRRLLEDLRRRHEEGAGRDNP
jgi:hypothetical protein